VKIDIISDVVCPWCYIGKRRLERALASCPDLDVDINWWAFQLNPDMPPGGMERQSYLAAKFGSAEQARQIYASIEEAGDGENIAFRFDRIKRTPNTIDAHRMIRHLADGSLQLLLNRPYMFLNLPAAERAAVVLDSHGDAQYSVR